MLIRISQAGAVLGLVTSNIKANVETALGPSWNLFDPRCRFTFDHPYGILNPEIRGLTSRCARIAHYLPGHALCWRSTCGLRCVEEGDKQNFSASATAGE